MADIAAQRQAKQQQQQAPAAHDPAAIAAAKAGIAEAEAAGNHGLAIALKSALSQYLSSNYPTNLKGGNAP